MPERICLLTPCLVYVNHLGRPGLVPHHMMEASMHAWPTRSGRIFTSRLILALFLLIPWPALAEEGTALPLSKVVLYSSGVGYFQHDGE
jgi:hypothetical protein